MQQASPDAVRAYQEKRLRRLVRWAGAASPFYRRWFRENGVHPGDIRTLEDLAVLPLLDRTHLVESSREFCTYPPGAMWKARSSGTSGRMVTAYRTPGSSAFELAVLERQWAWFGVPHRPRRVMVRYNAGGEDERAIVEIAGARQLQISSYMLERTDLGELVAAIRAFSPDAIQGWPSSLGLLASLLRERGLTLPVRAVITSSEVLTAEQVALLSEVFVAPVVDHYGQTERVAMAGACESGGYHLFHDYGITELAPVPDQPGRFEIIGTPLHNWGFPLFRYRTGDTVRAGSDQPCPCGRTFPLVGAIDGRVEDLFTTTDGRLIPLPGEIFKSIAGLRESQVAQLAPGSFEVRLVPERFTDLEPVRRELLANIDRYYGPGQSITFKVLDSIPRPESGKFKRAVVEARS